MLVLLVFFSIGSSTYAPSLADVPLLFVPAAALAVTVKVSVFTAASVWFSPPEAAAPTVIVCRTVSVTVFAAAVSPLLSPLSFPRISPNIPRFAGSS